MPITTPIRNPQTMTAARIASTTAYSSGGSNRRLSQTHSTMNARPRNTSTPPTIIRGISPTTSAPTTTAASGTSAAISPAARASTRMCAASAVKESA